MNYFIVTLTLLEIIIESFTLEIIPIENNILPIQLGRAFITNRNLQLIYHIDLSKIEKVISEYQKEIENIRKEPLGFAQTANFKYLRHSNELNIKALEELLNENIKTKRGLINLGGKISKILFGTLDSDDEELFKNYFDGIKKNEKILMRNQKNIATVVNDLKNKYYDKFQKITENLKLLQIVPALQEVEQMHLMTFQIKDIKNTIDEIQTAVSFARLHLLHESILPYNQFSELIKNVTIIPVHHLKDYYQLCYTKVIFKNKMLLFLISIPTIYEKEYELYKFYFLSQNNETLPYTDSYLLSQEEILQWSTSECHPVEKDFLCNQESMKKPPRCLINVLKTHKENCTRTTSVPYSDLKLLEDGNILSLDNRKVIEKCPHQIKHYFIPPMALLHSKCTISNSQKEIFPLTIINEEKYIILPKQTHFIKNDSQEELIKNEDIPDIVLEELEQWNLQPIGITFAFILTILIIIIVIAFACRYFRKNVSLKATPQQGDTFFQEGEELHNMNPY